MPYIKLPNNGIIEIIEMRLIKNINMIDRAKTTMNDLIDFLRF